MAERQVVGPALQEKYVMAPADPATPPLGVPAVQLRPGTGTADHDLARPARLIDALNHARCAIAAAGSKRAREAGPIALVGQQADMSARRDDRRQRIRSLGILRGRSRSVAGRLRKHPEIDLDGAGARPRLSCLRNPGRQEAGTNSYDERATSQHKTPRIDPRRINTSDELQLPWSRLAEPWPAFRSAATEMTR